MKRRGSPLRIKGGDKSPKYIEIERDAEPATPSTKKKRTRSVSKFKPKITEVPSQPVHLPKKENTKLSVKSPKPKKTPLFESSDESLPEEVIILPVSSSYTFIFKEKEEKIKLENESTIESQEEKIKNILKIEKEQQITFRHIMKKEDDDFDDDDEDDHEIELLITDLKRQMKEFFKDKIRITLRYKKL